MFTDSSSNEELQGVSSEKRLYLIPKTEVNQLRCHIRAYLKSFGQIPIIYQIPRSRFSQKRTQPYSDGEILTSNIDDLIIDTIFEIHQPIIDMAHSETFEGPLDFQGDSTFFNFYETQAGGSRPPETPKNNPPLDYIPSPRLNFTFGGSMAANPQWLTINTLAIAGPQNDLPRNLDKLLPKFDPDDDILPKTHLDKFMLTMNIMNVQHEDVACRLFCLTLQGKASSWFSTFRLDQSLLGNSLKMHLSCDLEMIKHQGHCY